MPRITPRRIVVGVLLLATVVVALFNLAALADTAHAALFSSDTLSPELSEQLAHHTPIVPSKDLQTRLQTFLSAPLLPYATALAENQRTCGTPERADRQVNPDQLRQQKRFWKGVGNVELATRRLDIVKHLEKIAQHGGLLGRHGGGRGIVMTAGNKDTTWRMLVSLRILRLEYHCKLPVEVFTFPGEIKDERYLQELKTLDATVKELDRKKIRSWKNFQIKADAIVQSSFEEVLYLDSDNIPLRDPAYLFDSALYKGPGQPQIVFWPDLNKDHPSNAIWRLTGKTCDATEWEVESGQIVINKTGNGGLNLVALHIAAYMQQEHDFYFRLSEGDKDTFRYAFWVLGLPYSVSPRWLSSLGFHAFYDDDRFCGIAMLQYDIETQAGNARPLPLFVHANLLKHRKRFQQHNGGGRPSDPFPVIKRVSNDLAHTQSLDSARMWVYQDQKFSMCVDLELPADTQDGNKVIEEEFEEAYDGAFRGFTKMYRKHGGRDGGW